MIFCIILSLLVLSFFVVADTTSIDANKNKISISYNKRHDISKSLYGIFFEEINFAGDGGIYDEQLRNRDFECLGRGCSNSNVNNIDKKTLNNSIMTNYTDYSPWQGINSVQLSLDNTTAPYPTNPTTLRIDLFHTSGDGISNFGYWGIAAKMDRSFRLSFYARASIKANTKKLKQQHHYRHYEQNAFDILEEKEQLSIIAYPRLVSVNDDSFVLASAKPIRVIIDDKGWMRYDDDILLKVDKETMDAAKFILTFDIINETKSKFQLEQQYNNIATATTSINRRNRRLLSNNNDNSNQNDNTILLATVWMDAISLFPLDSVAGIFRKDLFEQLEGLKPSFIRFPGGNYLEGYSTDTHWDWKKSLSYHRIQQKEIPILDSADRAGHFNAAWNYWTTDGLGLHEYLLLCEALHAEPQMSIFTGYSMNAPYIPMNQSDFIIQDAIDALEYANGDDSTKYGALRILNGHPAPFNLKRLEVGNEESSPLGGTDGYRTHYNAIVKALRANTPDLIIIGSGRWEWSLDPDQTSNYTSIIDSPCLKLVEDGEVQEENELCDMWDEHYYRSADELQKLSNEYDYYDRKKYPLVYVGEYASNEGQDTVGSLRNALSEASFIMGFENNADIVKSSSFAPLFANLNGVQWKYNLIQYNASHSFNMISYYVQKMFANALDTTTRTNIDSYSNFNLNSNEEICYTVDVHDNINTTKQGQFDPIKMIATMNSLENSLTLKVVNYDSIALNITIDIADDYGIITDKIEVTTLTETDPNIYNDLDNPERCIAITKELEKEDIYDPIKNGYIYYIKPWSLSFIKFSFS